MAYNMGLGLAYGSNLHLCKKKWRWMFTIPDVCGNTSVNILAPQKSARPDLRWKEINIQHLNEEVFFPGKPDWSMASITLYDTKLTAHPLFRWLRTMYGPQDGSYMRTPKDGFIKECRLDMYDGCGNVIEQWIYEDAWPQQMNFNDLDMGANEFVVCNLMLRYARAYIVENQ